MSRKISITCTAPVNIAVIKYWGKRDMDLNLPLNSSLSGTLHQDDLKTTTTVTASRDFEGDSLLLNDEPQTIKPGSRLDICLRELRSRAEDLVDETTGEILVRKEEWPSVGLKIVSFNNFPTAAGLASSAAGFGCLVASVGKLLSVRGDLTAIARRGSGSASRSLFGGWVKWEVGVLQGGSDSIALQVADEGHWPDMRVLVFVVRDAKKDVGSTDGMQQSVATSPLMKERAERIVPERMQQIEKAILERDFGTFAQITMVDSDDFHEVCHTTQPPIYYMNDISRNIVHLVRSYNSLFPSPRVAYTFDAGPNAVLYLLKEDVAPILSLALRLFPFSDPSPSIIRTRDATLWNQIQSQQTPQIADGPETSPPDSVKYIIHTEIGPGPIASPLSVENA